MTTKASQILGVPWPKFKSWLGYWLLVAGGLIVLVFLVTTTWIGVDVRERCLVAKNRYAGDCVAAMIQLVDDESNSFAERNGSIWALGQMGDVRAKAVLEKYYTGNIPDREPLDAGISQYELKKAIALVNGGFNATHFVWQWWSLE